jgi:surface protein
MNILRGIKGIKSFIPPVKYTNATLRTKLLKYFYTNMPPDIDINSWDTSEVTDMSDLFNGRVNFNKPLDRWDTSNVTNMEGMFLNNKTFNQSLDSWNVSRVTNMKEMFIGCRQFNQPLNNWNTSNVSDMEGMFLLCNNFNQPLDQWNTENVTNMSSMFVGCKEFNQPLNTLNTSKWNTSKVINMAHMFDGCIHFNQPLNNWDTHLVRNMSYMFRNCIRFNQPLTNWNIQNVTNRENMFLECNAFDLANSPRFIVPAAPQGVAYEIHNAFNQHYALNKDKYFEIIGLPNHPDSIYTSINVIEYIKPKLLELIQRVYPADAINVKTDELNQILTTINNARELSEDPDTKLLLGKTVDFLVTQPNEFVRFYLEALKYDCLNAYPTGTNRSSCVKGMIERFYLTMGDTAYALCPDPDTCNNPKYNELVSLFNKRFDKNELTQEWNETFLEDPIKREDLLKLDKEERKDHYRQFMIQKYRDAGQIPTEKAKQMVLRDIIEPEIVSLDYVFDGLQFGGTKKKTGKNKSRKNKSKSRKNKSRKNKSKKNKSRNNKSKSKKY